MRILRLIIFLVAGLGLTAPVLAEPEPSTPHDQELTPEEKKERLPKFDTKYLNYSSNRFNLQLKRLVNFVDKGGVRWNASLDEVFLTLEGIPNSRQLRVVSMAGLAVGARSLLGSFRRYLSRHNIHFLWLNLHEIAIFGRHRRVPVQIALSYNIRGETGLQFFWQRRRCLLFSRLKTARYRRLTAYAYLFSSAGMFVSNTTYPNRIWKARGVFWHERILRTEFFVQYLNEWPQHKRYYLRFLFNLPEIIQDMRLVIFKKPDYFRTVY